MEWIYKMTNFKFTDYCEKKRSANASSVIRRIFWGTHFVNSHFVNFGKPGGKLPLRQLFYTLYKLFILEQDSGAPCDLDPYLWSRSSINQRAILRQLSKDMSRLMAVFVSTGNTYQRKFKINY